VFEGQIDALCKPSDSSRGKNVSEDFWWKLKCSTYVAEGSSSVPAMGM
jgi:hypothetical protein